MEGVHKFHQQKITYYACCTPIQKQGVAEEKLISSRIPQPGEMNAREKIYNKIYDFRQRNVFCKLNKAQKF